MRDPSDTPRPVPIPRRPLPTPPNRRPPQTLPRQQKDLGQILSPKEGTGGAIRRKKRTPAEERAYHRTNWLRAYLRENLLKLPGKAE